MSRTQWNRFFASLFLLFLGGNSAFAQTGEQWQLELTNTVVRDFASLPSGDLFLVHEHYAASSPMAYSSFVTRVSATGEKLWTTALPHSDLAIDSKALAIDSDGNSYVAARWTNSTIHTLTKLSAAGVVQWQRSNELGRAAQTRAAVDSEGSVVWATAGTNMPASFKITKFASDGAVVWTTDIPEAGAYDILALAADSFGNFFVSGRGYTANDTSLLAKLSAEGAVLWTYRSIGGWPGHGSLKAIAPAPDGGAYIETDGPLLKFSATGDLLWRSEETVSILKVGQGGEIYVNEPYAWDAAVLTKFDAEGTVAWRSPLPTRAFGMALTVGGDYALGMITPGYWTDPFEFGAISPQGDQRWFSTYSGAGQSTSGRHGLTGASDGSWRLIASSPPWPRSNTLVTAFAPVAATGWPAITQQPESTTVVAGQTALFRVEAVGDEPLAFNWTQSGGSGIDTYDNGRTLSVVTTIDSRRAQFYVAVTNSRGRVASHIVSLNIIQPPQLIRSSPQRVSVALNGVIELRPVFGGTEPLAYQWYHDGTAIPDGTNAFLRLTAAGSDDAGQYSLVVSNSGGITNSEPTEVLVNSLVSELWRQHQTNFCCAWTCNQVIDSSNTVYLALGGVLMKYSAEGQLLWSTNDDCDSAISDLEGGIIHSSRFGVSRRDSEGALRWHTNTPSASLALIEGRIVSGNEALTFLELDGNPQGTAPPDCDDCMWRSIHHLLPLPGGGFIAAGFVNVGYDNTQIGIARVDADGQTVWFAKPGLTGYWPPDYDVAVGPDDSVVLSAVAEVQTTVKYNSGGQELWREVLEGAVDESAAYVAIDGAANVVAASPRNIVKYSADGTELWRTRSGHPSYGVAVPKALQVDDGGNIYLIGATSQFEDRSAIEKLDGNGNTLWVAGLGTFPPDYTGADLDIASNGVIHASVQGGGQVILQNSTNSRHPTHFRDSWATRDLHILH